MNNLEAMTWPDQDPAPKRLAADNSTAARKSAVRGLLVGWNKDGSCGNVDGQGDSCTSDGLFETSVHERERALRYSRIYPNWQHGSEVDLAASIQSSSDRCNSPAPSTFGCHDSAYGSAPSRHSSSILSEDDSATIHGDWGTREDSPSRSTTFESNLEKKTEWSGEPQENFSAPLACAEPLPSNKYVPLEITLSPTDIICEVATGCSETTVVQPDTHGVSDDISAIASDVRLKSSALKSSALSIFKSSIDVLSRCVGEKRRRRRKPLHCPWCTHGPAVDHADLERHIGKHLQDLQLQHFCEICKVGFVHLRDLEYHLKAAAAAHCGYQFLHLSRCQGHHPIYSATDERLASDRFEFIYSIRNWELAQLQCFNSFCGVKSSAAAETGRRSLDLADALDSVDVGSDAWEVVPRAVVASDDSRINYLSQSLQKFTAFSRVGAALDGCSSGTYSMADGVKLSDAALQTVIKDETPRQALNGTDANAATEHMTSPQRSWSILGALSRETRHHALPGHTLHGMTYNSQQRGSVRPALLLQEGLMERDEQNEIHPTDLESSTGHERLKHESSAPHVHSCMSEPLDPTSLKPMMEGSSRCAPGLTSELQMPRLRSTSPSTDRLEKLDSHQGPKGASVVCMDNDLTDGSEMFPESNSAMNISCDPQTSSRNSLHRSNSHRSCTGASGALHCSTSTAIRIEGADAGPESMDIVAPTAHRHAAPSAPSKIDTWISNQALLGNEDSEVDNRPDTPSSAPNLRSDWTTISSPSRSLLERISDYFNRAAEADLMYTGSSCDAVQDSTAQALAHAFGALSSFGLVTAGQLPRITQHAARQSGVDIDETIIRSWLTDLGLAEETALNSTNFSNTVRSIYHGIREVDDTRIDISCFIANLDPRCSVERPSSPDSVEPSTRSGFSGILSSAGTSDLGVSNDPSFHSTAERSSGATGRATQGNSAPNKRRSSSNEAGPSKKLHVDHGDDGSPPKSGEQLPCVVQGCYGKDPYISDLLRKLEKHGSASKLICGECYTCFANANEKSIHSKAECSKLCIFMDCPKNGRTGIDSASIRSLGHPAEPGCPSSKGRSKDRWRYIYALCNPECLHVPQPEFSHGINVAHTHNANNPAQSSRHPAQSLSQRLLDCQTLLHEQVAVIAELKHEKAQLKSEKAMLSAQVARVESEREGFKKDLKHLANYMKLCLEQARDAISPELREVVHETLSASGNGSSTSNAAREGIRAGPEYGAPTTPAPSSGNSATGFNIGQTYGPIQPPQQKPHNRHDSLVTGGPGAMSPSTSNGFAISDYTGTGSHGMSFNNEAWDSFPITDPNMMWNNNQQLEDS